MSLSSSFSDACLMPLPRPLLSGKVNKSELIKLEVLSIANFQIKSSRIATTMRHRHVPIWCSCHVFFVPMKNPPTASVVLSVDIVEFERFSSLLYTADDSCPSQVFFKIFDAIDLAYIAPQINLVSLH